MGLHPLMLVALGVGGYWMVKDSKAYSAGQDAESRIRAGQRLTSSQSAALTALVAELARHGLNSAQIVGAIANAWHESNLNLGAVGDGGSSVGPWQLHIKGGGKGMSVADRQDPVKATARIMEEAATAAKSNAPPTADAGDYAYWFCYYVERPANKAGDAATRAATARRWWGSSV